MSAEKKAVFTGLAAGILFAVALFSAGSHWGVAHAVAKPDGLWMKCPDIAAYLNADGTCQSPPPASVITTVKGDGVAAPRPLSAIAVTRCGLAVALYVQLDATHLLRADPRQSDMFTAVDGEQRQDSAGPMKWDDAYKLAQQAVLTSHVLLPCTDGPQA